MQRIMIATPDFCASVSETGAFTRAIAALYTKAGIAVEVFTQQTGAARPSYEAHANLLVHRLAPRVSHHDESFGAHALRRVCERATNHVFDALLIIDCDALNALASVFGSRVHTPRVIPLSSNELLSSADPMCLPIVQDIWSPPRVSSPTIVVQIDTHTQLLPKLRDELDAFATGNKEWSIKLLDAANPTPSAQDSPCQNRPDMIMLSVGHKPALRPYLYAQHGITHVHVDTCEGVRDLLAETLLQSKSKRRSAALDVWTQSQSKQNLHARESYWLDTILTNDSSAKTQSWLNRWRTIETRSKQNRLECVS
jgi:hypothetical protein